MENQWKRHLTRESSLREEGVSERESIAVTSAGFRHGSLTNVSAWWPLTANPCHIYSGSINSDREASFSVDDSQIRSWHLDVTERDSDTRASVCWHGSAHRGYCSSRLPSKQLQHIWLQHLLCDTRASALRDRHPKLLGESSNRSFCLLRPAPLFLM